MNCVLIDDERFALKVLETHLSKMSHIKIVGSFTNVIDAYQVLQAQTIDLVFLDIEMPNLNGFDFLKTLQHQPNVIITTAYRDYALTSYDFSVVDYLLKPISFERMVKAINKLPKPTIETVMSTAEPKQEETYFYVQSDRQFQKIKFNEIRFIESLRNQLKIVLEHEIVITTMSMNEIEQRLPSSQFLRVHRSYLVGLKHIDRFTQKSITIEDQKIPIGSFYKHVVIDRLNRFVW